VFFCSVQFIAQIFKNVAQYENPNPSIRQNRCGHREDGADHGAGGHGPQATSGLRAS